jgi:hypothetical protein
MVSTGRVAVSSGHRTTRYRSNGVWKELHKPRAFVNNIILLAIIPVACVYQHV